MLPTVIPEGLVKVFKYWREEIRIGMCYQNELYTKTKSYGPEYRLQAYEAACQLSADGVHTCITVSKQGYSIWQNLKIHSSGAGFSSLEELEVSTPQ